MTDTDKIVAAIFAASMCGKVKKASPADYLKTYYEILEEIKKRDKSKSKSPDKPSTSSFTGLAAELRRGGRRKRPII